MVSGKLPFCAGPWPAPLVSPPRALLARFQRKNENQSLRDYILHTRLRRGQPCSWWIPPCLSPTLPNRAVFAKHASLTEHFGKAYGMTPSALPRYSQKRWVRMTPLREHSAHHGFSFHAAEQEAKMAALLRVSARHFEINAPGHCAGGNGWRGAGWGCAFVNPKKVLPKYKKARPRRVVPFAHYPMKSKSTRAAATHKPRNPRASRPKRAA